MKDTGNRDLRKLAHDYYRGELGYDSYRRARTQLLDRITAVTGDAGSTRSITRQANKPGVTGQSPVHKAGRSRFLRAIVWVIIVALLIIFLIVWAMKSGWIPLSLGQPDPADTVVTSAEAERAGISSRAEYGYFNG